MPEPFAWALALTISVAAASHGLPYPGMQLDPERSVPTGSSSTNPTSMMERPSRPIPNKVYGPENNDLMLQLRKRGMDKVILGGMSANVCTEAHMRELIERGFEVAVVSDATAAAIVPEGNGYQPALVNFRFIANAVWTTAEAVRTIEQGPAAGK